MDLSFYAVGFILALGVIFGRAICGYICPFGLIQEWLAKIPRHLFKSITFDNGKEFAKWREIANKYDISTYFAEVGAPNQRGLNENNNGIITIISNNIHRVLTSYIIIITI